MGFSWDVSESKSVRAGFVDNPMGMVKNYVNVLTLIRLLSVIALNLLILMAVDNSHCHGCLCYRMVPRSPGGLLMFSQLVLMKCCVL